MNALAADTPLGRNGLRVGAMAYGVAALGNLLRPVPQQEWEGAVPAAWESGVRYFDVAPHYGLGLAERRLGLGLRGRPRDEFLISTKVGRLLRPVPNSAGARDDEGFDVPADFVRVRDYSRDGIRRSLESSLERLGLDRVDIAFVHDPDDFYAEALDHAFPALEELRAEGMITSYGAGMNQSAMLTRFVERTDLDVVMLAGRYTLLEQDRARRPAARLSRAQREHRRRRGLQLRRPRHGRTAADGHVQLRTGPRRRVRVGEPTGRRLQSVRHSLARGRRPVSARPPGHPYCVPGRVFCAAGAAQRRAVRDRRTRRALVGASRRGTAARGCTHTTTGERTQMRLMRIGPVGAERPVLVELGAA